MIIIPLADRPEILVINAFPVAPENQLALIERIRNAGDPATIPGLLSMYLLREKNGTRVTNHMCWASREAFEAAVADDPAIGATRRAIREFTTGPVGQEAIAVKLS